ncbi:MAG: DUF1552 domain-containing protein [Myxococcales bacterium]|nr:DUF1552 domain-containing protein [Myxococcales bacterium]
MTRSRPELTRRQWLRGAGSALVAIPLLPSLLPRSARAAIDAPRRFVFVGSRWGRDIDRGHIVVDGVRRSPWYPHGDPADVRDGVGVTRLADVAGFDGFVSPVFSEAWDGIRDKFTIVRGLDGMQLAGDGHGTAMAMTGSGTLPGGRVGFGYSIDAVMEESAKFYAEVPVVGAIRTSVGNKVPTTFSYSSKTGALQRLVSDRNPFDVYARVFHPETRAKRASYAQRHTPVLNGVMEEYRALLRPGRLSTGDRYKLEGHLSLISDIEKRLGVSVPDCGVEAPTEAANAQALHELTMDLEIAALSCGMTNIVSHVILHHNSEIDINRPEAHSAAHGGRSRPEDSGRAAVPQWHFDKWVMDRVATFIRKLDAMPDGDGSSLLDHTVLQYGNWEARGYHNFYDMPVVLAGSPDVLSMGYLYDYRPRPLYDFSHDIWPGRPYNEILITLLHAVGLQPEDYERFGQKGFGHYDGYDPKLSDHYKPFLQVRNTPLPLLYKGP